MKPGQHEHHTGRGRQDSGGHQPGAGPLTAQPPGAELAVQLGDAPQQGEPRGREQQADPEMGEPRPGARRPAPGVVVGTLVDHSVEHAPDDEEDFQANGEQRQRAQEDPHPGMQQPAGPRRPTAGERGGEFGQACREQYRRVDDIRAGSPAHASRRLSPAVGVARVWPDHLTLHVRSPPRTPSGIGGYPGARRSRYGTRRAARNMATARLQRGFARGIGFWHAEFRWRSALPRSATPTYSRRAVIDADHGSEPVVPYQPGNLSVPTRRGFR